MDGLSTVQFDASQIAAAGLSNTQPRHRGHPAMDAAAKALGMSASDLRTALKSGQSLADIAKSKGVSQDTLTAAMATAIQQANPNISSDQATKMATAIATRTRSAAASGAADPASTAAAATGGTAATGGHHHHHHAMATAMTAASSLLGMSASDLTAGLKSGQSLADIAKSKGVSQDDLVKAISGALQQGNSGLSAADATSLATSLVTRTPSSEGQPWSAGVPQGSSSTFSVAA